ncbi:TfuA domain protein core [Methanohalobium evestigatum Z-7303]|uniref:TfuA domain protein core n=1 Tax=Methanohalobium evestigatum (strain ATCC BAA-1072 / DSM 3721 / NBRC 107634 / OCM 161 / Z-7303) TaxID=644295 RepID=D7EBR6_METEZ|nr:TfuA-related McrA-glycine thioamidation protein [Methanohalobium evestigatum]ADI74908.1 TfuA domain protein core [Methanohalobium evestigatum Z-7303]
MEPQTSLNIKKPKNPRITVFAGTSITHEDAKEILNADYKPPVYRCNIDKAMKEGYNIIGIIDGVFFDKAAVSHKEIIKALKNNVIVVGGCSMGALRASELDDYGMIGAGKIYEQYRDGVIEADDEVAVATNPDTFEPVSKPLINIRQTLKAAYEDDIIDDKTYSNLIEIAKHTYYPYRSYTGIIKQAVKNNILTKKDSNNILRYCRENEIDIKRQDAIAVLNTIIEIVDS